VGPHTQLSGRDVAHFCSDIPTASDRRITGGRSACANLMGLLVLPDVDMELSGFSGASKKHVAFGVQRLR
jgi:hypothetical protein